MMCGTVEFSQSLLAHSQALVSFLILHRYHKGSMKLDWSSETPINLHDSHTMMGSLSPSHAHHRAFVEFMVFHGLHVIVVHPYYGPGTYIYPKIPSKWFSYPSLDNESSIVAKKWLLDSLCPVRISQRLTGYQRHLLNLRSSFPLLSQLGTRRNTLWVTLRSHFVTFSWGAQCCPMFSLWRIEASQNIFLGPFVS